MDYAVELGLLETNPIRRVKWTAPKVSSQVDRRSVVNPRQARALLEAVRAQQPSGPRLVTFFAVMYYAGLRPEEAINLAVENVILPSQVWDEENQQWRDPADDEDWASCTFAAHCPMRAASGPTTEARRKGDNSSTGLRETAALCRSIPS